MNRVDRSALGVCLSLLVLGLAVSWTFAGCDLRRKPAAQPTFVERGERFETGSEIYDQYFKTVHDLHTQVATGRLEERDARTSLAQTLGLLPTAEPEQILRKFRNQAKNMPAMKLEIDTENKVKPAEVVAIDDDADKSEMGRVIMATANAKMGIAFRMSEIPERAKRMQTVAETLLESAAQDFADQPRSRRDQIAAELRMSREVLTAIADDARSVAARTRVFVTEMQSALKSAAASRPEPKEEEPEEKPKPKSKRWRPKPGQKPRPAPKPKPVDDFEP